MQVGTSPEASLVEQLQRSQASCYQLQLRVERLQSQLYRHAAAYPLYMQSDAQQAWLTSSPAPQEPASTTAAEFDHKQLYALRVQLAESERQVATLQAQVLSVAQEPVGTTAGESDI